MHLPIGETRFSDVVSTSSKSPSRLGRFLHRYVEWYSLAVADDLVVFRHRHHARAEAVTHVNDD